MDFFQRQDAARGRTTRLVVLFTLAVVAIVVVVDLLAVGVPYLTGHRDGADDTGDVVTMLIWVSALTLVIIGFGTVTKTLALRSGGSAVAMSVGAVPVDATSRDPRLRVYVNVVEEMAIASGIAMPRLFVLENEAGINAFAAGFRASDAAICVTGGALDRLNRDELQGVIGHEFSHVLNGDMRLNIKLMGLLYGILLLAIFGLRILPFSGQSYRGDQKKTLGLAGIALILIVVGFVGQLFARLIQAAVSRQREWLADASAVQFTRQTTGLAGALKKIGGIGGAPAAGSALVDKAGESQLGHMLFGEGRRRAALFATHPPLEERIAALTGERIEALEAAEPSESTEAAPTPVAGPAAGFAPVGTVTAAGVADRVGNLAADDLARGARLNDRIPDALRTLAGQRSTAVPLVLALLLDPAPEVRAAQLAAVDARLGAAAVTDDVARQLSGLDPALALPLAQLTVPQLVARPDPERAAVAGLITELVRADGRVTAFEYGLGTLLRAQLVGGFARRRASIAAVDGAQVTVLAVVAAFGNADPAAAERAFAAAVEVVLPGRPTAFRPPPDPWAALDDAWPQLLGLLAPARRRLIEAVVVAVSDDGRLTVAEAELLRVTCGVLGAPLPPLLG